MLGKVLLTGLAFVAFGLARFLFNILVLRRFSPAFLGEVNEVLSSFLFIPVFYAPCLGMVVSKFVSEFRGSKQPQKANQVFSLAFLVVTALAAVCTGAVILRIPSLQASWQVGSQTLYALAPVLFLYSLYAFLRASYFGFDRIPLYLRNEVISSTVFFMVLIAALVTRSPLLALLPFASHSVVFVAIAIRDLRGGFRFGAIFKDISPELRRYAHFFGCTVINSVAGPGAFHLGIILTARLTGDREVVGYYSALLYSMQPLYLLPVAIATVLMPTISHHHGAGHDRQAVGAAEQAFRPLFLIILLVWGVGVILGWEAIQVVTGRTAPALLLAFEVILFGVCLYLISAPPTVLLNATEHVRMVAVGGILSTALAIGLWMNAVPVYGVAGAAIGYGALQAGKALWVLVAVRRLFAWRAKVGGGVLATLALVVVLGAASLMSRALFVHVAIAGLFAILFLVVYARSVEQFIERLADEARAYAGRNGAKDEMG